MIFGKIVAVALCMTGVFLCSGAEIYQLSRVEDWGKRSPFSQHAQNVLHGCGRIVAFSTKIYPYNPKKTYTFKGLYRQLPGSDSNIFRIGILPLDKDQKPIEYVFSHPVKKTDTVLQKAVAPGDTSILVQDASGWKRNAQIAFNTKVDLSDLPNKNIIRQNPQAIEKTQNGWVITFAKPVGVAIPAGKPLRQHYVGSTFRYAGSGTGGEVLGDFKCTRWDIGTEYFQAVVVSGANGIQPGEQTPVFEMKNPYIEVTE